MNQFEMALHYLSTKASITARHINQIVLGQPQYTEEKYDKMVKESYNKNVWVYACVRAIARAAASIPLEVYEKGKDGELIKVENHPLQLLLDKPNEEHPRDDFMEAWVSFLMLSGNGYVEMNGPSDNGPPIELWLWRPERVEIVPGEESIKEIRLNVNGEAIALPYERALHTKLFHPTNDYFGLTPLQIAMRTVDMDNSTTDWNTTLVQNYAAPGGILRAPKDVKISDPERRRITRTIRRLWGGKHNAGKTHLVEGGLEYQAMGLSPKDMDFIDSRRMTREEICAVFGVPPQLVGIQDKSTYNNYKEARQAFHQDTVLPTLDKIVSSINHKLAPLYGARVVVGYDESKIEALQESANEKYERISNTDSFTLNEKRAALGQDEVPGGDVFFIPRNVVLMNESGDPVELALTIGQSMQPKERPNAEPPEEPEEKDALSIVKQAELKLRRKMSADAFNDSVDERSKIAERVIAGRFMEEHERIEEYLKGIKSIEDVKQSDIDAILSLEKEEWLAMMIALYSNFAKEMYDRERKLLKSQALKLNVKFDDYDFADVTEYMQEFIRVAAGDSVSYIHEWTRQEIRSILSEAFEESWAMSAVVREMKQLYFDDFMTHRSYRIARTEMMAAASYGKQQGVLSLNLPINKIWVSTYDSRTRDSHKYANQQTVDVKDYYNINGYSAMFPGDPELPAKERIHCRCVEVYEVRMDEV
ncbi:phage portal protein [Sporosarcina soli]|uniref:Phage portal protein n=1 Tax=Sporosarcina soli TaxID=334736 RepID=A0ABW0TGA8_9BACL